MESGCGYNLANRLGLDLPRVEGKMVAKQGSLARRSAVLSAMTFLAVSAVLVTGATQAGAEDKPDQGTVKVEGGLLAGITTSPLALTPAFSPTITDYVLRCQAGSNTLQFSLNARPGGKIKVGHSGGTTVTVQETLTENQALIVSAVAWGTRTGDSAGSEIGASGRVDYWIRCLPHDFPQLSVSRPGNPSPGWYLTGNLISADGSATYAMVLDRNGTPVWYRSSITVGAHNVTLLSKDVIAWDGFPTPSPGSPFEAYDLANGSTRWISAIGFTIDPHELQPMQNGHLLLLSSPARAHIDLRPVGGLKDGAITDCMILEVDAAGRVVWQWRASDHIAVGESVHPNIWGAPMSAPWDVFHCNSADIDPESGDLLLSLRHTDAVYRIDRPSGRIIWKLGGNSVVADGEPQFKFIGDPLGGFDAQHDARFEPQEGVSLYDDESFNTGLPARGVQYQINAAAGTATLVWSFQSPDGLHSLATGSFQRLDGGKDNIIGWGWKSNTLLTEVDREGNVLLNVTFPNGDIAYRVRKVATTRLDHDLLRATAGLPPAPLP
jgi:hypothetical protein